MKILFHIVLAVSIISCGSNNNEGGLELSDEQLKEIMKRQAPITNPGQGDAALIQLEQYYQSDSSNIDNVYNLAFLYCGKCLSDSSFTECTKAEQYLNRVISLQKDYREGKAFYNISLCFKHQGKLEPALGALNSFIAINKDNPKPPVNFYIQKASILHELGRSQEACSEIKNAEKLDSTGLSIIKWKSECK